MPHGAHGRSADEQRGDDESGGLTPRARDARAVESCLGACGIGSDVDRIQYHLGIKDNTGQLTKWRRLYGVFGKENDTLMREIGDDRPEIGFYYPGQYWHDADWIKNLVLFFDGVAMLIPKYMADQASFEGY